MASDITHLAFTDEHNHDSGSSRFGSIALITMKKESYEIISKKISKVISEAGVDRTEFKWTKTKHINHKKAAINLIDLAIEFALNGQIRIDAILWDYQDSRHNVDDRDNIKNFHIMYNKLLTNTMHKFWPDESIWIFYPDETTCVDWEKVQSFTNYKSIKRTEESLFELSKALKSYHVRQIKPVSSKKSPVSLLADLFAGLIPYSRYCYDKYEAIKIEKEGGTLFETSKVEITVSDRSRYEIILQLLRHKAKRKLGISFKSSKGFRSLNPSKEFLINFWWYEPQHEKDKAPIKIKEYVSETNLIIDKPFGHVPKKIAIVESNNE
jgi:hypothetical protein